MKRRVYLDHLAGTPLAAEVREAMRPFLEERFGSANSLHSHGLAAREAIDTAREQCAELINGTPKEILFTGSATEANNLAVKGVALSQRKQGTHIVLSNIEHPSIDQSVVWLEDNGFTATRVAVNGEGCVAPNDIAEATTDRTVLIVTHHASHDLGTLQDIPAFGAIAAEPGIPFLVDATASGGWLSVDVVAANIAANVLIKLAGALLAAVTEGGVIITSGVLDTRLGDVVSAFESAGGVVQASRQIEDWTATRFVRAK